MKKKNYQWFQATLLLVTALASLGLSGCRLWAPPESKDHNPQPWAQQESWQGRMGLPGFSSPTPY